MQTSTVPAVTQVRSAQIVFFALVVSQLVYAGVLRVVLPASEWSTRAYWPAQMGGWTRFVLLCVGGLWVTASTLPTRLREAQLARLPAGASVKERLAIVFTSLVIRWAILEMIVLGGFALSMLEKAPNYIWPLLALSLTTMLAGIPTHERMQTWAGMKQDGSPHS